MDGISCGYSKFLSHFAFLPVAASAVNSLSIVECVMHIYFIEAKETAPPAIVKIYPNVDLLSLALVIQLASKYSSSTAG